MLDESNTDSVGTESDILPALNRGLDFACDILARRYPDPFVTPAELVLVNNQSDYEMPEDCFEDRILKIEIDTNGTYQEVRRISFSDGTNYEGPGVSPIPSYYMVIGRNLRFIRTPSGTFNARIWYFRQPEQWVLPQGRITRISESGNYVIVDQVGSSLSTESDTLQSYINIIDAQTGIVKCSLQIQTIDDDKLTFRTSPVRSSVVSRDIDSAIPSTVGLDDIVCSVIGTAVPYYGQPVANFVIESAVADITRKLGGDAQTAEQILNRFERQVATTFAGRETTARIKRRSSAWGTYQRRWWINSPSRNS